MHFVGSKISHYCMPFDFFFHCKSASQIYISLAFTDKFKFYFTEIIIHFIKNKNGTIIIKTPSNVCLAVNKQQNSDPQQEAV